MKFPSITNTLIFKTAPILIGTVLASSPSLAATFAFSQGNVTIDNFSKNPYRVGVETNAEIFVSENGGEAYADAFAEANFVADPDVVANADNSSTSVAEGTGRSFFALGESSARVIGDFWIEAGETLSFDFLVDFNLETSIDRDSGESANAKGNVSFFIFETTAQGTPIFLLDYFGVSGNLETPGNNDFFTPTDNSMSNFTLVDSLVNKSFGGGEEYVSAFFDGSYQKAFGGDRTRNLRLVEFKTNYAQVQSTPEPSTTLAFLLFSALGVATGFKSRINKL
jgi:hypothetical protein